MKKISPTDNKSQSAMFWRAHNRIAERLRTFVEIQHGPNPLTDEDLKRLAKRYPDRWSERGPI